jgi:transposase
MRGSRYDKAFKKEAIGMVRNKRMGVMETSEQLGIHIKTLYRWLDEFKVDGEDAFPGKWNLKPADEELRRLKRENDELKEENEILKKAAVIFAKHRK